MLKLKSKKTFTLMELMISVVILLLVLGSLLFGFTSCVILNEQNSNLATAINDAQFVLEDLKSKPFSEALLYTDFDIPGEAVSLVPAYIEVINVAINNIGVNLVQAVVTVNWIERGRIRSAQLSTVIAKTA